MFEFIVLTLTTRTGRNTLQIYYEINCSIHCSCGISCKKKKKGISSTIYWYIHFQLNGYIKSYILMEKEEFNHESMKVSFGVFVLLDF